MPGNARIRQLASVSSFVGGCGLVAGCILHKPPTQQSERLAEVFAGAVASLPDTGVYMRTDSATYAVRVYDGYYIASIAFALYNRSGATISENYCRTPGPPQLERELPTGGWVLKYEAPKRDCKAIPPFRLADSGVYRDTLRIRVAVHGADAIPQWAPGSVTGNYRLKWAVVSGGDPDGPRAHVVIALSQGIRLAEQP